MTSNLLSFNDVEIVTNYIETNNETGLYDFISKKGNIICFLNLIKETIYNQNNSASFKLKSKDFEGDMIFDKSQFLKNIPQDIFYSLNINNLNFTLGYPTVYNNNFFDSYKTCIKKINNTSFNIKNLNEVDTIINILPIKTYNQIVDYINNNIYSKLDNIIIFETKRDVENKFTFNYKNVIRLLYFVCKYSLKYLRQLKVFLMKESNFAFTDFDRFTVEQSIDYYKVIKEISNDS